MGCNGSKAAAGGAPMKKAGKGKHELGYLNIRGGPRGQVARYLAEYCQLNYVEKTYSIEDGEWKNSEAKKELFANMPYISDGKTRISESMAVHQYIAEVGNPAVLGKTPQERAHRYKMQSIAMDGFMEAVKLCFATESRDEVVEKCMSKMEGIVMVLGDQNFVCGGDVPSIVDF